MIGRLVEKVRREDYFAESCLNVVHSLPSLLLTMYTVEMLYKREDQSLLPGRILAEIQESLSLNAIKLKSRI